MRVIPPTLLSELTYRFRNAVGELSNVDSPVAQVFDSAGNTVLTTSSLTNPSTGTYAFVLDPAGLTVGTYYSSAIGSSNSQEFISDGPEVFEVRAASDIRSLVSFSEAVNYLQLDPAAATLEDLTFIRSLIFAVTEAIESYCKRKFARETRTDLQQIFNRRFVFLRQYPVISITSIKLDEVTLVADDDFVLFNRTGKLDLLERKSGVLTTTIVAGVDRVPQDISLTALKLTAAFWRQRNREGVSSERLLSYSFVLNSDVFATVHSILNRHTLVKWE